MKKIIASICILLIIYPNISFSAPYKCDTGGVFDDKKSCSTFCGDLPCSEFSPKPSPLPCDTSKYNNFAYINGKTYALTKSSVPWASENTAIIRNEADNKILSSLLKSAGVNLAWIGVYDPLQTSTSYGVVDSTRFKTRNGSNPVYASWAAGEPNNTLNTSAIGSASLYGEYWVAIDQNGNWVDLGLNGDGSHKLLPALVEWSGELACVAGAERQTVSDTPEGMVCGVEDDKFGFNFQSCSEGNVFKGDKDYLCPIQKTSCMEGTEYKTVTLEKTATGTLPSAYIEGRPVGTTSAGEGEGGYSSTTVEPVVYSPTVTNLGGGYIDYNVRRSQRVISVYEMMSPIVDTINYPDFNERIKAASGTIVSSTLLFDNTTIPDGASSTKITTNSYTLKYMVEEQIPHTTYTCPETGRPCIESGGKYYCSPHDCGEGSNSGNYDKNPDETVTGENDADNNGEVDADGNCLGIIKVFPGRDSRCRTPGTQSKFFQCCKIIAMDEKDKPDFRLSKLEAAAALWLTGIGALAAFWVLFGDGLDFKVCNGAERQLWINRGQSLCTEIGEYCAEKWKGVGCVQKKKTYCCFDSEFSRAFNEAGLELLGRSWGTPESPRCGGFSPEELQELSAMGISDHPRLRDFADKLGKEYSDKLVDEFNKSFDIKALEGSVKEQADGMIK